MGFRGGTFESDAVEIEFAVGGRAGVTPAAVGEFIPFLGAGDVTLVAILPEYRADIFFFPAVCKTLLSTWGKLWVAVPASTGADSSSSFPW